MKPDGELSQLSSKICISNQLSRVQTMGFFKEEITTERPLCENTVFSGLKIT